MPISQAKIDANRRNAQKSSGPKTPEGKARSCRNSLVHGLTAQTCLLANEDPADLLDLLDQLRACYQPVGLPEEYLVERLAKNAFRANRVAPMEAAIINLRLCVDTTPDQIKVQGDWGDRSWAYMRDANGGNSFTKLARYEIALHREYDRTVRELERLQKNRRAAQAQQAAKPRQTNPPTSIDSPKPAPKPTPKLTPANPPDKPDRTPR